MLKDVCMVMCQNLPCSPAQIAAIAAGLALWWKLNGKSLTIHLILPLYSVRSLFISGITLAQKGHSNSEYSTTVMGQSLLHPRGFVSPGLGPNLTQSSFTTETLKTVIMTAFSVSR